MEFLNRQDQTIDLLDGRKLGYAEYGPATGMPVMLFSGAFGRYLKPCNDELLEETGVRPILVERPGYGLADFQPGHTLLDWPDDVAHGQEL